MEYAGLLERAKGYLKLETDLEFRAEVEALIRDDNKKEIEDRFYRHLEFGTGGLRGLIGGGYNRMNTLVVTKATQGLCDYLKSRFPGKALSACIAYDSRRRSQDFALATALVFAGNGVKAYLFTSLRPTPELSFAIRKLGADTGVVVTASHNPPAYNGYKAYWNDGAQVVPPHDEGIIEKVGATRTINMADREEALRSGLLVMVDREIDDAYSAMVKSRLMRPGLIKAKASEVKVVYTPLHGTGAMHFERVMGELGLSVSTVPEQREPDGEFPTVAFPNPEETAALRMALDLGKKERADVVMATDPDADRLGIAVPDGKGDFVLITGNQLGSLHLDYLLLTLKELGRMPPKPACIKSIVTTDLQAAIAAHYGAQCFECLTGFKWIAALMRDFEARGLDFVYATEESYGHLIEDEVRDKDGISAAALTAEMTLYWRSQGKGLLDRLEDLYALHGFYEEKGTSKYFEGAEGMQTMAGIMKAFRDRQPAELGGVAVASVRDILSGLEWKAGSSDKAKIDLPASDVLQWRLADGTLVVARPSGTEPKIKFYILSKTPVAKDGIAGARAASAGKIALIEADLRKALQK